MGRQNTNGFGRGPGGRRGDLTLVDLRRQLVAFVQQIRTLDLKKQPSVSETIDWARVLVLLHVRELDPTLVRETLNVLLKFESDIEAVEPQLGELLLKARREAVPVR